jgi:hypothetical protein
MHAMRQDPEAAAGSRSQANELRRLAETLSDYDVRERAAGDRDRVRPLGFRPRDDSLARAGTLAPPPKLGALSATILHTKKTVPHGTTASPGLSCVRPAELNMATEVQQTEFTRAPIADQYANRFALCNRVEELNREMMRLPLDQRRSAWDAYYDRLGQLVRQ